MITITIMIEMIVIVHENGLYKPLNGCETEEIV